MNRPLPAALVLFAAGIVLARHIAVSFAAVIVLAAFLVLLLFFIKRHNLIFYIISAGLVLLLGAAAFLNFNHISSNHITHLFRDGPDRYYIQGVIASSPDYFWTRWGKRRSLFLLKTLSHRHNASWIKTDGLCRVDIKDSEKEYYYGDSVVIFGRLRRPPSAANPGQFDYAGYLKAKGVYALIDVNSDDDIASIAKASPLIPQKLIFSIRANVEGLIRKYLPHRDASVLNAMLIGKREGLSRDLKENFVRSGTAHILAVSGLHVAIISAVIFFILRWIGIPRRISSILVVGFLSAYALLAGARPPILRATIMISIYLLGYILERDFDIYSALSLAGIVILVGNPMQLFEAGFVLSFACVFSIAYLTPRLESFFVPSQDAETTLGLVGKPCARGFKPAGFLGSPISRYAIKKNALTRYTLRLILGSIAAYIGIAPLIAYYFNIVSPVTILANLFVVPLVGIVLSSGILFVIAGSLCAPLAAVFAYLPHMMLSVLMTIISFASDIPFGYFYVPDIPLYAVAVYYIFILLAVERKALGLNWFRISAAGLLIINIFAWKGLFAKTDRLRVTFLDVADGGPAFLEFPDGKTMLINAGRRTGHYPDQAETVVLPFIWSRGRRSIDVLFLTHPDTVHMGAVLSVLEKARVRYLLSRGLDCNNRLYRRLKDLIASSRIKDIKAQNGMRIEGLDDASILVVSPSLIKLTYKDANFLFLPDRGIFSLGESGPQAIDPSRYGAITIITDGLRCFNTSSAIPLPQSDTS